jgi:diadenosine tetraphosphate (Ap4A) HIT family hydrolase
VSDGDCRACLPDWPPAESFIADCGPARAYLHEDQFFPGWTLLILRRHATELYELDREERAALMEAVTDVARALAATFEAVKMNYELLGNLVPHIHWHLVPRLGDDPIPRQPVWTLPHEPRVLAPTERRERIEAIRRHLRP